MPQSTPTVFSVFRRPQYPFLLPVAVNDPAGRITAYTYDGRGNLISITDPAGYTTSYGYNAQWLPETITDALGHTTRHHYDAAGNPVRTDYPDDSHETFEYDRLNRLTAYIDGLGAKTAYELAVDTNNRWSW
ncbi:hypothetical protein [Rothia aeria]|uniref:hypothetical protein n=1 Tax=Rothia aeria TaxID=172042 RepID=UPI00244D70EF